MKIWSHKNFHIHEFEELESTNSKAFELYVTKEIFDHSVIFAHSQTKGRGREDRQWSSPKGNLYFSLVLQSVAETATIPQISFVAAVALRDAMEKVFTLSNQANKASDIKLKWPNDLLIDEKKVSGLLLENKILTRNQSLIVLGIGVNTESNPSDTIFPAANLQSFGVKISPTELLKIFLHEFEISYKNWCDFGFVATRRSWLRSAYNLNQKIAVRSDASSKFIEGIFVGLDEEGKILLQQNEELLKISAGEIGR